jgi:8-oxo-dGTP pyrophosphatase MutT (NUDIX family)
MVDDELGWDLLSGHQPHEAVSVEVLPLEDDAPVAVPSPGSDPHVAAFFLGKNDLAKGSGGKNLAQPSVAGLCLKAHDTGRILMLQRGLDDDNDPAAGTWEMPGGHIEAEDPTSLHAALREWQEEVGQPFPAHGTVKHTWTSPDGIYQGHVVVIPSEKDLSMKDGRVMPNPDDPKGDCHEQAAWWTVDHARKNPALRAEVKAHTPWKDIENASLDATKAASAWDPISNTNPQPGRGTSEPAHSNTTNPASTGWAAGEDPDNWGNLDANPEPLTPSLGFDAALHDEPEPALPVAYGDEDATMRPAEMTQADLDPVPDNPPPAADLVPDQDADIHLLNGGSALPNSYHASIEGDRVAAIVAAFRKSAVGQQLATEASGGGDEDIAAAARAHLEKTAAKQFNFAEQQELISEGAADGRQARNLGSLQIKGTHYELLDAALKGDGADPTDLFL